MATVRDFYTGDGTTVLFPISFEYLDQSHVLATVNNVPTTDFGFVNGAVVTANDADDKADTAISDSAAAVITANQAGRAMKGGRYEAVNQILNAPK